MRHCLIPLAAFALAAPAAAQGNQLHVSGWARPTAAGQQAAAAYLTIHNGGKREDRLLSVSTTAAAAASLHVTSNVGGIARMRPSGPVAIAPGRTVTMAPGGLHLMLTGLKAPLRPGTRLPLALRFERAGLVRTALPVQMSAPDARHAHH